MVFSNVVNSFNEIPELVDISYDPLKTLKSIGLAEQIHRKRGHTVNVHCLVDSPTEKFMELRSGFGVEFLP